MQVEGCSDPQEPKRVLDQYRGLAKYILTSSASGVATSRPSVLPLLNPAGCRNHSILERGCVAKASVLTVFPGAIWLSQGPVPVAHGAASHCRYNSC